MFSIVGSGPAMQAVESALGDTSIAVERGMDSLVQSDCAVVVGPTGSDRFTRANEQALDAGIPWFAVELGGIGGFELVESAVTGLGPNGPCYDCLRERVQATRDRLQSGSGSTENGDEGDVSTENGGESDSTPEIPAPTARLAGAVAGHRVVGHALGNVSVAGSVILLPYDERSLLRVPGCACHSGIDRTLSLGFTERSVADSLERAEQALDDLVGIVTEVGEAESFPVPYYLATIAETAGFSDVTAAPQAAGVDIDWNEAFMKALGEGLERYCAGVYRTESFDRGPPDDIEDAIAPEKFVCRTEPANESVHWLPGTNLQTEDTVALPAEFVTYPPPEQRYRPPVTTGLGLGNGGVEAVLSGLYEVIERDAAMLAWYSSFDPLGLEVQSEGVETLRARARSENLDVSTVLVTMDIDVPVVVAAVHRDEWPRFAVGTGANLDVTDAAMSALSEALQNWTELRGMGRDDATDASGAIGAYADAPGPARTFVETDTTVPAATVAGPDVTGKAELDTVLARLADVELSAYAARTTTADVSQLGFEAVRALVPAAQPLSFGEMYFGTRATDIPQNLGFEPRLDRDHHPYP